MKIIKDFPPIIDDIDKAFPGTKTRPGVLFCWGEVIFNPSGITIPRQLMVHESVHSARQDLAPAPWWKEYLSDPKFRITEEILAHKAEWSDYMSEHMDRNQRAIYFHGMALRLSGPLYGNAITFREAKRLILQ